MISTKILVSIILAAACSLAAPTPYNDTDISLLFPRQQDYTFDCDAAPPAEFPGQGGLIRYSTASSTLHQAPLAPGRSGYPHKFYNSQNIPLGRSCDAAAKAGNVFEFPVFSDGHLYDWDSKPKNDPGPARVLYTTPSKDFCGVIAHNGPGNTGPFHLCGIAA